MNPELTLLYVHGEEIGYARMGSYIAAELVARGITLYDAHGYDDGRGEIHKGLDKVRSGGIDHVAPPSPTNTIVWASTPTHAPGAYQGQFKAMLTMWESMRIPEQFRETFHEFDLLMVPSWQNVELFSRFHPNVKFVPLGIDPTMWNYSPPPTPTTTFDFLISGRGQRKGIDITYEAFQTVFGGLEPSLDRPSPRLIMKSLKGHGDYYAPGVKHITGRLSAADELALYRSVHCYIQPSRGEGFGLQPLQALALGRPTILTNAHGHESYAHLGIRLSSRPTKAAEFIFGDAGDWWEPSFDETCEAMWDVYTNYEMHCRAAKESAAEVAAHWTWSNTTDAFLEALGDNLTKPYTGDGTWVAEERRLFEVVTLRDHLMEGAGTHYQFIAGEKYYVIADIKRVLFDAGLLDPICLLDDDPGIAPQQIEGLDYYLAQKAHCSACGQVLNGRENIADKYFQKDELERRVAELEAEVAELRAPLGWQRPSELSSTS